MTAPEIDLPTADRWITERVDGPTVLALSRWDAYRYACDLESCEPHDQVMWEMMGRPIDPLGSMPTIRCAAIRGTGITLGQVAAYLPSDYYVWGWSADGTTVIVVGTDHAGWTLDEYVLPHLATGGMSGEEVMPITV